MSKIDDSQGLARAAISLRARGVDEYDAFLVALRGVHTAVVRNVVAAPPETVQVMQGRARGLADLLAILDAPEATVRKLESTQ